MAYDPTARTGDVLDILGDVATLMDEDGRWVCRNSTTGRGLRLHQTTGDRWRELPTFRTPREAVVAFLQREGVTAFACRPSEAVSR